MQETYAPGMSVSLVARQHGIAANQVFTWRRLYCPGRIVFERLDSQLKLLGPTHQLLRGAAELGASVARQLELQPGDLGLGSNGVLRHRRDDLLQRLRVIGKLIGRDRHLPIESYPLAFGAG